jgi:hypothetical protein
VRVSTASAATQLHRHSVNHHTVDTVTNAPRFQDTATCKDKQVLLARGASTHTLQGRGPRGLSGALPRPDISVDVARCRSAALPAGRCQAEGDRPREAARLARDRRPRARVSKGWTPARALPPGETESAGPRPQAEGRAPAQKPLMAMQTSPPAEGRDSSTSTSMAAFLDARNTLRFESPLPA